MNKILEYIGNAIEHLYRKFTSVGCFTIVAVSIFLAMVAVVWSMISLITSERGEKWRQKGATIHREQAIELPPLRGAIFSSDDRPLAITAPFYHLYFDFRAEAVKLVHNDTLRMPKDSMKIAERDTLRAQLSRDLDTLANVLVRSFDERGIKIDRREIRKRWQEGYRKQSRSTLMTREEISYLQYLEIMSKEPFAPRRSKHSKRMVRSLLSRMYTQMERSRRFNPFGSLGLRTIGSVYASVEGGLTSGRQGIELGFDSLLRGQVGRALNVYAAQKYNRRVLTPPVDGANIYTNLDMNKQNQMERIMRRQLGHFEAQSGTAILMEVSTGKVLAMTNLQRTPSGAYREDQNMAVNNLSEPGSTFKVASMLVALNDGVVSPEDPIDVGNGTWVVGKRVVRDHNAHHGGYGMINVSQTIEKSSNVGLAKIIVKHYSGREAEFVQKLRNLGFGDDLRLEIPGSALARIRMPNKTNWYGTTLAWMSFGYETQIPPLYTTAFFNAIANGGKLMKPYLVREIRDANMQLVRKFEPTIVRERIARPESIRAISEMMRRVVTDGTGKLLKSDIVAISGKSGTAQLSDGGSYGGNGHQVSFCGFFPSEAPRYTLMVVIRRPSPQFAAGGGSMAGPVVKELAEAIISMESPRLLDSLDRPTPAESRISFASGRKSELQPVAQRVWSGYRPDARISSTDIISIDTLGREHRQSVYPQGMVPAVVGMSATDATYTLQSRGYRVHLIGYGKVIAQSEPAGAKAKKGHRITLTLEHQ